MAKVLLEFVNTCPHCAGHERDVRDVAAQYGDAVETRFYVAGKDFDYVRRYGVITRGTLIVNETVRYEEPSRGVIERAVAEAMAEA
ncbi:MAG: thioredoxin-like (seleno)protein SaoT [Actinomycetota bacterium]|nr:thioredoxin-like (seleno)protein SaoT [Actinomycetota bacterium]MDP3630210.1 thioredoxin-like (seleno)protein SaoT [Actinomycetota bacterium]